MIISYCSNFETLFPKIIELFVFRVPLYIIIDIEFNPSLSWNAYKTLASAKVSKIAVLSLVSYKISSQSKSVFNPVFALIWTTGIFPPFISRFNPAF